LQSVPTSRNKGVPMVKKLLIAAVVAVGLGVAIKLVTSR
jgi:hypothetical protein